MPPANPPPAAANKCAALRLYPFRPVAYTPARGWHYRDGDAYHDGNICTTVGGTTVRRDPQDGYTPRWVTLKRQDASGAPPGVADDEDVEEE